MLDRWLHHIAEDQFHVWVEAAHRGAGRRRCCPASLELGLGRRIQRGGLGAYDKTWMGLLRADIALVENQGLARVGPLGEGSAQSFQIAFTDFVRADDAAVLAARQAVFFESLITVHAQSTSYPRLVHQWSGPVYGGAPVPRAKTPGAEG